MVVSTQFEDGIINLLLLMYFDVLSRFPLGKRELEDSNCQRRMLLKGDIFD